MTVGELPKFTPSSKRTLWNAGDAVTNSDNAVIWPTAHGTEDILSLFNTIGGDKLHNNVAPGLACYLWLRKA